VIGAWVAKHHHGTAGNRVLSQPPDDAIYLSQPATGEIPVPDSWASSVRPHRYASAKAQKNYAATSPVTRQSGKKKIVPARFIRNDRLADRSMTGQRVPAGQSAAPREPAGYTGGNIAA
jgi:hypothetical protein